MAPMKVVVVGAGIGGCAAAVFLTRLGCSVSVLESRGSREEIPKGGPFLLAPNGVEVIHSLGLAQKLFAKDNEISEIRTLDMLDYTDFYIGQARLGNKERHGQPTGMVTRRALFDLLLDEVERRKIAVHWSVKVEDLVEDDEGVTITWRTNGQLEEDRADFVVGADGIWSVVRKSIAEAAGVAPPHPVFEGLVSVIGIMDVAQVPCIKDYVNDHCPFRITHGRSGFFGLARIGSAGKRFAWAANYSSSEREKDEWRRMSHEQAMAEVKERCGSWPTPIAEVIQAADANGISQLLPVYQVQNLDKWHSKRMVLIGDAAHATPPHAGQGASMALEDAAYLAYLLRPLVQTMTPTVEKVSSIPTVADLEPALKAFTEARSPRAEMILTEANKRGASKKDKGPVAFFLIKWIMKFALWGRNAGTYDSWYGYKVPGMDEWARENVVEGLAVLDDEA